MTSIFNKVSLIWQETVLCRVIVWNCPREDIQHFRIEEIDRIYDFLAGFNFKFDVVRGHILG